MADVEKSLEDKMDELLEKLNIENTSTQVFNNHELQKIYKDDFPYNVFDDSKLLPKPNQLVLTVIPSTKHETFPLGSGYFILASIIIVVMIMMKNVQTNRRNHIIIKNKYRV